MTIQGDLLLQVFDNTDKVVIHSYGNGGSLNVHGGITADGVGSMEVQGDLALLKDEDGLLITKDSTLTITGHLDSLSVVDNNGTLVADQGVTLEDGAMACGTGSYDGAVTSKSGAIILGGDLITGTGTTTYEQSLDVEAGSFILTSAGNGISVAEAFTVAGTIYNEGHVTATSASGLQVGNQGMLTGNGTYRGHITLGTGSTLIQGSKDTGLAQMVIDGDLSIREGAYFKSYIPISPVV